MFLDLRMREEALDVMVLVVRDGPAREEEDGVEEEVGALVRLRFFWKKASGIVGHTR